MDHKEVKKYLIVAILLFITYLSYLIIKPFVTAILASFILVYIFYPFYRKLKNRIKNETASALIITMMIILLILLPVSYLAGALIKESLTIYKSGTIQNVSSLITSSFGSEEITRTIDIIFTEVFVRARDYAAVIITNLPSKILYLLVTIYTTFGMFLIGDKFVDKAKRILPVRKKDELIKHFGDTTYAIIYGLFITAIIEVIVSLVFFKIIGTGPALLLSLIIGFLGFIPFLGPALIWVPYAVIEFMNKNTKAVVLLIILGVILFCIENFLRPKITGNRAKVNPLIILLGTLGGIKLFGIIGIIMGPIFLSSIIIIIEEYYQEVKNEV